MKNPNANRSVVSGIILVAVLSAAGSAFGENYYFRSRGSLSKPQAALKATLSLPALKIRAGAPIDGTLDTTVGNPRWTVTQTPDHPSLDLTPSEGSLSGTAPEVTHPTTFSIGARASAGIESASTEQASVTVYPNASISGGPTGTVMASVGTDYPSQPAFTTAGIIGTASFELLSNSAPTDISAACPGLSFSTVTATISGRPTAICSATLAVKVTDSFDGASVTSSQFSIAAPLTLAGTPKLAYPLQSYSFDLTTLTGGGRSPYTYLKTSGEFPTGLAMAADGKITGTVSAAAVASTPTIRATDAGGQTVSATLPFGIGVSNALAFGLNSNGQLGDGTLTARGLPVRVSGGKVFVQLAAGVTHSCGVVDDGTLQCWGSNDTGKLGMGDSASRQVPTTVPGISGATAVAVGNGHTCAVVSGGAVKCWGANGYRQLGDNSTTNRLSPVLAVASGATAIAVGNNHTCAIVNSKVNCWGYSGEGQTNGSNLNATAISSFGDHTCAIVNGGAQCWGQGSAGQLGLGYNATGGPYQVSGLTSGVTAISAGTMSTCAIVNGSAKCWGYNYTENLGDGTNTNRPAPVQVIGLTSGVTAISAGQYHSCAIVSGAAKCWGNKNYDSRNSPVGGQSTGFTAISAGGDHTLFK